MKIVTNYIHSNFCHCVSLLSLSTDLHRDLHTRSSDGNQDSLQSHFNTNAQLSVSPPARQPGQSRGKLDLITCNVQCAYSHGKLF